MNEFYELDTVFMEQLEAFIEYLQAKNIRVMLYLPPYHEYFYDIAAARKDDHPAFFEIEDYCRGLAEKYGLEIYGSYDARSLGLAFEDFWDSYRMKPESIDKILPTI
jgi:hypothetical protein